MNLLIAHYRNVCTVFKGVIALSLYLLLAILAGTLRETNVDTVLKKYSFPFLFYYF